MSDPSTITTGIIGWLKRISEYSENGGATLTTVRSGELAGTTSALQLPDVPCRYVWLKARSTNTGSVFVGGSGVTVPDNSTDTTTGIEITAGDTIILPIDNLNRLYRICSDANQRLTYLALS